MCRVRRLATGNTVSLPGPAEERWSGTVELRHRDGRTLSVWLLAHHGAPRQSDSNWLVLTPLNDDAPDPQDDFLMTAALTQSPCATAVYDDRLRLHGVNEAMAAVLGLPAARIRGLSTPEVGGNLDGEEIEEELRHVLESGQGRETQGYVRAGGEERAHAWLGLLAPLIDADGRVRGVCMTAHDFSEHYMARERLRLVNEASVRIGTTLDVTRTAQELADVCVPILADLVSVDLLD